jgi:K+-transporting ATPase KdpF subunit
MIFDYSLAAVVVAGLLVYLIHALLRPGALLTVRISRNMPSAARCRRSGQTDRARHAMGPTPPRPIST